MHTASAPGPTSPLLLEVMGATLDVDLPEALRPHEDLVRRAWSRCLPAPRREAGPSPAAEDLPAPARAALESFTSSVTLRGIQRLRGTALMLHAAGLADPVTGGTVVLVASSGTGKTTAARVLGRHLAYVSDETVCVDPADLTIAAYPKPLSVVTGPGSPKAQVSPDDLQLLPLTAPARAHSVLLLQRSPGTVHPRVTDPLPLVTALSTLVPNISALPSLPDPLVTLVRVLDACGGVRAVRYAEIDDVAPQLVRAASAPVAPTARTEPLAHWEPQLAASSGGDGPGQTRRGAAAAEHQTPWEGDGCAGRGPAAHAPGAGHLPATVALGPWVQALENPEDPSQLLLLLPERLVVLAGIAPLIWHVCREDGPQTPAALTRELVAACEADPHADRLTRECVAHLLHLGVLRPGAEQD